MKAVVLVAAALTGLLPAAPTGAVAAIAHRSALTRCPQMVGPPVQQGGRTLRHYVIGAHGGVTCAFARTWVSRILRESTPTSSLAQPTGPGGWHCIGNAKAHVAFNGSCRSGAKSLSWGAI